MLLLYAIVNMVILSNEDRLQASLSDVYGRQILTSKVDPRTVRVNIWKYYDSHQHPFAVKINVISISKNKSRERTIYLYRGVFDDVLANIKGQEI